jgi:hypothetical protein
VLIINNVIAEIAVKTTQVRKHPFKYANDNYATYNAIYYFYYSLKANKNSQPLLKRAGIFCARSVLHKIL